MFNICLLPQFVVDKCFGQCAFVTPGDLASVTTRHICFIILECDKKEAFMKKQHMDIYEFVM